MKVNHPQEIKPLKFSRMQMPNIFSRILFVHNILNLVLVYLVPKKLKAYIPYFASFNKKQEQPISSTPEVSPTIPQKTMDSDELTRVFAVFDRNGDGRITQKELKKSLENMGIFIHDTELVYMIEKIDVDGDGCVDIGEFETLYKSIMDDAERKGEEREEDMKEAFDVFDQNGDGFISVEELKSVLSSLGLKQGTDVADCRKMIMKIDGDGNGMVDYNEFKNMMRRGGVNGLTALT